jgi:tetratricopeptide (TPR) repeat protein
LAPLPDKFEEALRGYQAQALTEARVGLLQADLQSKNAEIARLTEEKCKLQLQLEARAGDTKASELSRLLASGDLEGAVALKAKQVRVGTEQGAEETERLARDYFELGVIQEFRFDWGGALTAYREAWRLSRHPEYGFKYAYYAAREAQHQEAVLAYENVLKLERELAAANPGTYLPLMAETLRGLSHVYHDTQRSRQAESALQEALSLYRELAKADPQAYLPHVADALNSLAVIYMSMERIKEAWQVLYEALSTCTQFRKTNDSSSLDCFLRGCNQIIDPNQERRGWSV